MIRKTGEIPSGEGVSTTGGREADPYGLYLVLAEESPKRREWLALPPEGLVVGRDTPTFPGGPIEDPRLSRKHFAMQLIGGTWVLRDLGSRHGTFVNGHRFDGPYRLTAGDVIRVGGTVLLFGQSCAPEEHDEVSRTLAGCSPQIAGVRRSIRRVAQTDMTVMVVGETGTGKDLVARCVHTAAGRKGAYVPVNCGTLTAELAAAELFGAAPGVVPGAYGDGLFRAAEGGTLFLDEVGDLPPNVQVHLLRVLEDRRVRTVGAMQEHAIDVSVISGTSQELESQVRAGRFRADLYARLVQWPIQLPPLRARRIDIPFLVDHALAGYGDRPLTARLVEALLQHAWPLNVRELINVVTLAARSSDGPVDLTPEVEIALRRNADLVETRAQARSPAELATEEVVELLVACRGRVSAVAKHLGFTRQQLYRLMESRGLDPDDYRS